MRQYCCILCVPFSYFFCSIVQATFFFVSFVSSVWTISLFVFRFTFTFSRMNWEIVCFVLSIHLAVWVGRGRTEESIWSGFKCNRSINRCKCLFIISISIQYVCVCMSIVAVVVRLNRTLLWMPRDLALDSISGYFVWYDREKKISNCHELMLSNSTAVSMQWTGQATTLLFISR